MDPLPEGESSGAVVAAVAPKMPPHGHRQQTDSAGAQGEASRQLRVVGTPEVAYKEGDELARRFLALSLVCPPQPVSVTLNEFLNLRVRQEEAGGMKAHYTVLSDFDHGRAVIIVGEEVAKGDGAPIPGVPGFVMYEYWMDGPGAIYAGSQPATRSQDPLSFFEGHRWPVCAWRMAQQPRAAADESETPMGD